MDTVKYDEAKYNEIKEGLTKLVQTAGYDPAKVNFIPASAFEGDNIFKKSENMSWYTGPTVAEQIDNFDEPEKPVDLPLTTTITRCLQHLRNWSSSSG